MKETGIIFSTEMVKAILEDRKTQTRRVIKPQFEGYRDSYPDGYDCPPQCMVKYKDKWIDDADFINDYCPFGQVGDRLWVREALYRNPYFDEAGYIANDSPVMVNQTYGDMLKWRWKKDILTAMFMPKEASRITLEITEIRVERVQEITLQDIINEGTPAFGITPVFTAMLVTNTTNLNDLQKELSYAMFRNLWDSINAKRGYSWESNPWVWVIEFKKI